MASLSAASNQRQFRETIHLVKEYDQRFPATAFGQKAQRYHGSGGWLDLRDGIGAFVYRHIAQKFRDGVGGNANLEGGPVVGDTAAIW